MVTPNYTDNVHLDCINGIRTAYEAWNYHNQNSNCSGVIFFEAQEPFLGNQGDYDILVHTTNPIPGVGATAAGLTTCTYTNPLQCLDNKFSLIRCQQWLKYPSNAQISSQGVWALSFQSAVRKFFSHEIGHVMGLADQPQPYVQYASIMNGGHNTNDTGFTQLPSGGRLPWNPSEPTQCDNDAIRCEICEPTPTPTPPPQCQTEPGDGNFVFNGSCWYFVRTWYVVCDGVIVRSWQEWQLFYCEAE